MSMKPPGNKLRVYKKYNVWWMLCPSCYDYFGGGYIAFDFSIAMRRVGLCLEEHKKCQKKLT